VFLSTETSLSWTRYTVAEVLYQKFVVGQPLLISGLFDEVAGSLAARNASLRWHYSILILLFVP
jgi:hypothetical protein